MVQLVTLIIIRHAQMAKFVAKEMQTFMATQCNTPLALTPVPITYRLIIMNNQNMLSISIHIYLPNIQNQNKNSCTEEHHGHSNTVTVKSAIQRNHHEN